MPRFNGKYVSFDVQAVDSAIRSTRLPREKVGVMVLGRTVSYISKSFSRGTMVEGDLQKLCDFLSLDYASVLVDAQEQPVVKGEGGSPQVTDMLETLITGVGTLYEGQQDSDKFYKDCLTELKAINVKYNRLEKMLGQLVPTLLIIKGLLEDMKSQNIDLKSNAAITNGRLKDLVQLVGKGGNPDISNE